jgi:hypothetical protein
VLAEIEHALARDPVSWEFPDESKAFVVAKIEQLTEELERREALRSRPEAPPWPTTWRSRRIEAAEIKQRFSVIDYLSSLEIPFIRLGRSWKASCPLPGHQDDDPSFNVRDDGQVWNCFGCNRGGDVFTLAMYLTGEDDFPVLLQHLAKLAGISTAGAAR